MHAMWINSDPFWFREADPALMGIERNWSVLIGNERHFGSMPWFWSALIHIGHWPRESCINEQAVNKTLNDWPCKGNRRRSIGYCPHTWKSPLQPFHPPQQSPWLGDKYNELIHCTCITSSNFAGNDELVAVEDSIDVGNVLWIFYDCLLPFDLAFWYHRP